MAALSVNPRTHQFVPELGGWDNAYMHKKPRRTPLGKLMADYAGGKGIGDNRLAKELASIGARIPQSTITRIATGETKNPDEATLKPLAAFFGVSTAHLRGDAPPGKQATARIPVDLSPEALQVARTWMQLSPGRRLKFQMDMWWSRFFEEKFPTYRIGVANAESHEKFARGVEASWEKMMRQAQLFPES